MKACPRCHMVDPLKKTCVDRQTIGCPATREVDPLADIVLGCRNDLCSRRIAVPVGGLAKGTVTIPVCTRDNCGVYVEPVRGKAKG